jgi:uncharacterized membrane protein YkvA (DUF1232 family)
MRRLQIALCTLYLLFPTGGLLELSPDYLPIIGHLDELVVTFLLCAALGITPTKKANPVEIMVIGLMGLIGVGYMLFPTFGFLELVPDILPLVGNLDEAGAGFLAYNAIKTAFP